MRVKVKWSEAIYRSENNTLVDWRAEGKATLDTLNSFFAKVYYFSFRSEVAVYPKTHQTKAPDTSYIELNKYASDLMYNFFLPYVYSHDDDLYAFSYDEEELEDSTENEVENKLTNKLFARIYLYLRETEEYYAPLLEAYETMKGKLYNEVVSKEGISLMPQSANMTELGGTSDDLSKAVIRKDDGGTAMQRLNEIQASYRALYQEWADDMCERFSLWR